MTSSELWQGILTHRADDAMKAAANVYAESLGRDYCVRRWFNGQRGWHVVHLDTYRSVFSWGPVTKRAD